MLRILKDSFENTAYLEIGIPYFAFFRHKCSACQEKTIRKEQKCVLITDRGDTTVKAPI